MIERSSQTPAAGVSHVDALPPGTRLAEFEILGLLGVGGFGMVTYDRCLCTGAVILGATT